MMKQQFLLCLVALFSSGAIGQGEKKSVNPDLNLDFEDASSTGKPKTWFVGGKGYDIILDEDEIHSGKASLRFESKPGVRHFAVARSNFPVEDASGKKLHFRGWLKTEDVEGRIGLWWRVDGQTDGMRKILAFDNMSMEPVTGTQEWKEYVIEMVIPKGGTSINFGVLFSGTGTAWCDDLQIVFDGKTYSQPRY